MQNDATPQPPRVLVVEDDAATRVLLEVVIARRGYQVLSVKDGIEALCALGEPGIDAIILDLLLPRLDGMELLDHLAARRPDLLERVVVITAAGDSLVHSVRERHGVRVVLRKPLDLDDFTSALDACLESRHAVLRQSHPAADGGDVPSLDRGDP